MTQDQKLAASLGVVAVCAMLAGCGNRVVANDAAPTDAARPDAAPVFPDGTKPELALPDAAPPDAARPKDLHVSPDGPVACKAATAALQAEFYATSGTACSLVVRLDYTTRALLGYQVFCGAYANTNEKTARATAQKDTGYGSVGSRLDPPKAEDAYVFSVWPGDFGGMAVVSKRSGLSVFGGSIIWLGKGDITYPAVWRPAKELASGCATVGAAPPTVGYDMASGMPLGATERNAAYDVVKQTAVPAAFWGNGYLFDVVVIKYPRTVGTFDPTSAEWIVIVNGGWLE